MLAVTSDLSAAPVRRLLSGRFGWFLAGRAVDIFGTSMTTVALSLGVLQASGRATDLGVVLATSMVPTLVLLLAGGVLADRTSRRGLLIAANAVSAAAVGGIAVVLITGRYHLGTVAGLSLVSGAATAFASPALRGIVPELVDDADLQRANALLSGTRNGTRIIAPAVAGLLTVTAGGGWALAADAASCLVAAALFLRLPPGSRTAATAPGLGADFATGWRVFRSMRWVMLTSFSYALVNAFAVGPWNVLGPTIVAAHGGAFGWGAVLSVRAAGLLATSLVAVKLVFRRPLRTGLLLGVTSASPLLALGLSGEAWTVAGAAFVGGIGFTIAGVTWDTALQTRVPREALSRVSSFDDLFSFIAIPLSQVAMGPLAAAAGAGRVVVVCGVAYVGACLLPFLSPEIRRG
ncbi:major facilitator superfamily protein [Actinoplanes sp. SE50]|nr:major facilitator superfamily MFS_1 [Actinoplanes sp. SE50/110]ATO79839.1 major facilitator superfamily protein [Actinoplanes sp. SE50]SLL97241.1 major facilitator superfamily protein [Actinoplanes sp. SE50/110]